jgi:L-lactate dehydrogenase complex protein LldG
LRDLLEGGGVRVFAIPGAELAESDAVDYRRDLLDADVGVTFADYAVANTGTLALVSGGERHRLASLLPPVHVCLLDPSLILPDLGALLRRVAELRHARGDLPHALTLISGPSRTADIEHTVTTGVHGPRELHVLLWRRG